MNLNDLPDDCLLLIFDQFSDLGQFPKLTKVCKRWRKLVQIRLRKVTCLKYFNCSPERYCLKIKWFGKCILSNDLRLLGRIKLSQFLPNVKKIKFFDYIDYAQHLWPLANLLATGNPITQLFFHGLDIRSSNSCSIVKNLFKLIIPYLENIEHLTTNVNLLVENYFQAYGNHNKLKSLGTSKDLSINLSHVLNFADSMTNLKLLFINTLYGNSENSNRISNYNGPIFEKLESLYIVNASPPCFVTLILDFCPNLRNLTLILHNCSERIVINSGIKNYNLQGLELTLGHPHAYNIIPIVEKFPNVRYLKIRGTLTESQLTKIIILPHLSVLVIEDGPGQSLTIDSVDRIKTFCRSKKLNINFFHQYSCPGLENNELHKKFRNSFKRL